MSGSNRGGLYRPQARKASSTAGKDKGLNCRKTPNKVRVAKDSRFHNNDPLGYMEACKEIDLLNK